MLPYIIIPAVICSVALIPTLVSVAKSWWQFRQIGKQLEDMPSCVPKGEEHWLLGHIHKHPGFSDKGLSWLVDIAKDCKVIRFDMGPMPQVKVVHPDAARQILGATVPKGTTRVTPYFFLLDWLGKGLLIESGKRWFRNRRLLTPAFHFNILKPYVQVYNEAVDIFMDKVQQASKQGYVEICQPISLLTLDIILRCAFSFQDNVQLKGSSDPYVNAVHSLSTLTVKRVFNPFLWSDSIYLLTSNGRKHRKLVKYVHGVTEDLMQKRKQSLKNDPDQLKRRYLDFLDILLSARDEEGNGLSDLEIRNEADTFLFEGHDTTASAISWILYSLATHPKYQRLAQEEVDQVFQGREGPSHLNWDDLGKLPYTTQCIKEAMRLHSPVPFIGRQLDSPLTIDGHIVPAGTLVNIQIYHIHHRADVWGEDHMEYKPDRFHPDNMKDMSSHAFIPFSAGSRNCIGQNFAMNEEKTVVASILKRFTIEVDPDHPIDHCAELVMRATNGIKLRFLPRN